MTEAKTYIFQRHESCPQCGSADNLAVTWCEEEEGEAVFCNTPSCDYSLHADQVKEKFGEPYYDGGGDQPRRTGTALSESCELPEVMKKPTKMYRGIKAETLARFGVFVDNSGRIVFPYHDATQTLIGYKTVKANSKDFRWGCKAGTGMFGVKAAHSKYRLFITEGEFDAMALKDLTGDCAVSISCGAKSLIKEYRALLPFIESFEDVFICIDNDEQGKLAAKSLKESGIVDLTKVHFVDVPESIEGEPCKDVNDVLQAARKHDFASAKRRFMDAVYASKNTVPETIYDSGALADEVIADILGENETEEISTGIDALDAALGGWRMGEMTTILAPTSIGKSTFSRAIVASLVNRGHKCLLFSLEETPKVATRKIIELVKGEEIHHAQTREEKVRLAKEVTDLLVVHNQNGQLSPEAMAKDIDFGVRGKDVSFVLIDNLTRAIDHSEPYNSTNKFLDKLTEVTTRLNIHSFCVSHTKRTNDSTAAPTIQEARGSGLIEALSSNIISLGRKREEDVMDVHLLKNREHGELCQTQLNYQHRDKRFTELNYYDTKPRTQANQSQTWEEGAQSQGDVSTSEWDANQVRQQVRGEGGASYGGLGDSIQAQPDERTTSDYIHGDEGNVPRLHDTNGQGEGTTGNKGESGHHREGQAQESSTSDQHRPELPRLCSQVEREQRPDSATHFINPAWRPKKQRDFVRVSN